MKMIKHAAMIALLSGSLLTPITPAFADISPIQGATGTPQEVCEALLRPAEPSAFTTLAINVVPGTWQNVGDPEDLGPFGDVEGVGLPTPGPIVFDITRSYRNGGSPNVWGVGTSTLTYLDGSRQKHHFAQDQENETSFDCQVTKDPGGPEAGPDEIMPPGLQTTGNTTIATRVYNYDDWVYDSDPYVIPGEHEVSTLICISPNNVTKGKPGTWTRKHGFTGSCTDASNYAGTSFIPSHNNPTTDADTKY
jgi:hypothetical protein